MTQAPLRLLRLGLLVALTLPMLGTQCQSPWALAEDFHGDPSSPSQALLPPDFDFSVTHRTHPRNHTPLFASYPADHGINCAGPAPPNPAQHAVVTDHETDGMTPDASFFVCKNHMMSSMGEVEGYSVTAFWPRQEFVFDRAAVLEFDVNIDDQHPRFWWEILITPRDQMKVGAAQDFWPIDERYPEDRIVLSFHPNSERQIEVGTGAVAPGGWIVSEKDGRPWRLWVDPSDPALDDRRVRRRMRIILHRTEITWEIEKQDGSYDLFRVAVPGGLPFDRGLVIFKTHAYTPNKDGNFDRTTFHWDRLRFSGPVGPRYESYETPEVAYLQANGDRPIGDSTTQVIDVPMTSPNPVLFGQLHGALAGQVQLRINGGPTRVVHPLHYTDLRPEQGGCQTPGWSSFRLPLSASELLVGANTFEWTVGPRPSCAGPKGAGPWDGFSVKGLEVQVDLPAT